MPTVYQAICSNCGHQSPMVSSQNVALRSTDEDGYDTFRVLGHPGERRILEILGVSYEQAVREERLVGVHRVVCDTCSHINIQYKANVNEGCNRFLVAFIFIVLFCWLSPPVLVPDRFGMGWMLFFGFVFVNNAVLAPKRRRVQKTLPALLCCEQCNGTELHDLDSNKLVICPSCGVRSFKFECVGIS